MTAEGSTIKLLDLAGPGENYDSVAMAQDGAALPGDASELLDHFALGDNEEELIRLAAEGDVEGMKRLLQEHPDTDVNAVDIRGQSALQMAVESHDSQVVAFLLSQPRIRMRDSQLYAVRERQRETLRMLLEWEDRQRSAGVIHLPYESAEFPAHMTPLMLACTTNSHSIAHMLIRRGHDIAIPPDDAYKESEYANYGETLELGRERLDAYRALASPSYMCLKQADPILAAFMLSNKTEELANKDPVFNEEYHQLSEQCRQFAVDLLKQCRTSEEVYVLLKQDHDQEETGVPSGGQFPRIRLAAAFNQKEFVTHPNCQKVLQNLWCEQNADVQTMTSWRKCLYFLLRILAMPFVYIAYFFAPCLPFFRYWESPMCKFTGDVVSYSIFLALLIASIIQGESRSGIRVPNLYSFIDVAIWFWVSSFLVEEFRVLLSAGFKIYRDNKWILFRAIMSLLFLASFMTRTVNVFIAADQGIQYRDLERQFWPWNDPMLVSEALYCVATVMAFIRVLQLFQISQVLGPLQLSLSRMLNDILQMFAILFVVVFAFASGLTMLYQFYGGSTRIDDEGGTVEQEPAFTSWRASFRTLFWGMFGYGDIVYTDVIVDNTCGPDNDTLACHDVNTHDFTEGTGYFLYALYHIIMILTLLNMLIGIMANTLSSIQENSDQEWKFARSLIWLHYIERDHVMPHPFLSLPSVGTVIDLSKWLLVKCSKDSEQQARCSCAKCCFIEQPEDEEKQAKLKERYKIIMKNLLVRHTHQMELDEASEPITVGHFRRLKSHLTNRIAQANPHSQIQRIPHEMQTEAEQDKLKQSGRGTSIKSRSSAWSGVTDTELGDAVI